MARAYASMHPQSTRRDRVVAGPRFQRAAEVGSAHCAIEDRGRPRCRRGGLRAFVLHPRRPAYPRAPAGARRRTLYLHLQFRETGLSGPQLYRDPAALSRHPHGPDLRRMGIVIRRSAGRRGQIRETSSPKEVFAANFKNLAKIIAATKPRKPEGAERWKGVQPNKVWTSRVIKAPVADVWADDARLRRHGRLA